MNFVIPMAGLGSRFVTAGYSMPKYLVKARGKTLLSYALESLPLDLAHRIIFVVLEPHAEAYDLEKILDGYLPGKSYDLLAIAEPTCGQAETVLQAKAFIDNEQDLVIYNIDTYFRSKSLRSTLMDRAAKHDGIIGAFKGSGFQWSYAKVDRQGFVTATAEKKVISCDALTGLYHFTHGCDFVKVAQERLRKNITDRGEYFIAPMYNDLIMANKKFVLDFADEFIPLGTPEDLKIYEDGYA